MFEGTEGFDTKEQIMQKKAADTVTNALNALDARIQDKKTTNAELVELVKATDWLATSIFGYNIADEHLRDHKHTGRSIRQQLNDAKRKQQEDGEQ